MIYLYQAKDYYRLGKAMAKMRQYTYLEMTKIVKRNGYEYARCTGDHCIYKRKDGNGTIVLTKKKHINPCIARRLIKEHNLIVDL
jgi:predicted RNA binding protein YcfA (HicA-like mRNA interferase family)